MRSPSTTVRRLPAPLAWMGLIFYLSSLPDLSTHLGTTDLILRKLAHITEYGILTTLWWWALRPSAPRPVLAAALIALAYSGSDELHQTFIRGRHGTPVDTLIDSVGILGAGVAISRRSHTRPPEDPATG